MGIFSIFESYFLSSRSFCRFDSRLSCKISALLQTMKAVNAAFDGEDNPSPDPVSKPPVCSVPSRSIDRSRFGREYHVKYPNPKAIPRTKSDKLRSFTLMDPIFSGATVGDSVKVAVRLKIALETSVGSIVGISVGMLVEVGGNGIGSRERFMVVKHVR